MLIHLHVKNLALIEEIEVDFGEGLNILTGETGAGKSILLGSIQLILGQKMSREMIREHAPYALVELVFQIKDPRTQKALEEQGIFCEENQIFLSRKMMEGRSINRINGEVCTISQMKAAASLLLDIHGQNEHQSLLYSNKQLEILDAFGKEEIAPCKKETEEIYRQYQQCCKELDDMGLDEEQQRREASFLEFEIQEIENAGLAVSEDEELEARYKKMNNARQIAESLQFIHEKTGYERDDSAGEAVGSALREITKISGWDKELENMEGMLGDIDGLLNDFNREVSAYLEDMTFEEEEFHTVESRLDLINNLKAKYGQTIPDIFHYKEKQQKKLEEILTYEERKQQLKEKKIKIEEKLAASSHVLSETRKKYAKKLSDRIMENLKDLNFLNVDFEIAFERLNHYTAKGFDEVEYRISTNPGETKKNLAKVVSGGELSRIMLAIKTLLADKDQIETLIFDEIDTGISGRTAQKVSEKMAVIGRHHQVLCITHLPQIAAMADVHFQIEKQTREEETVTEIYPLSEEASILELARLLSGAQVTERVVENAREMKELAQVHKTTRLKQ